LRLKKVVVYFVSFWTIAIVIIDIHPQSSKMPEAHLISIFERTYKCDLVIKIENGQKNAVTIYTIAIAFFCPNRG